MKTEKENKTASETFVKNVVTTNEKEIVQKNVSKTTENFMQKMFKQFENNSIRQTSKGSRKETIYKNDVYLDCVSDKEKKVRRRQLRNLFDSFLTSILREKNNERLKMLVKDFLVFYKASYSLNDFTVESLISLNSDDIKKTNVKTFLEIVKKHK